MSALSQLTLLYVEDDNELRKQFIRILQPRFKKLYEAVNGIDAINQYKQYSPDIILIDINLPKMDGLEVIEQIRSNDTHTAIVVLSAYSDQTKLLRAIKLGLSEYLIKPIPYEKLLQVFDTIALTHNTIISEANIIHLKNSYSWKKKEKVLYYHDKIISLSKHEIIFLEFMIEQVDTIVTFDRLENLIWNKEERVIAYSSLTQLLKRLRKKLPSELIDNIYGEGYRIVSK